MTPETPNATARRRAQWLRRLLFPVIAITLGLVAGLLLLETALRVRPQMFSYRFQNLAFSKYDILPDGMYVLIPMARTRAMRADYRTRCCFNGYCWLHSTDHDGFRNPTGFNKHEVLLFGDSMIYGHGVEESDTVSAVLRDRFGHAAYNMARQGDCLYDHYVLFRLYVEEYRPRTVLLFVFMNDFQDVESHRSQKERAEAPEIDRYDYDRIRRVLEERQRARPPWLSRSAYRLHSVRVVVQSYRNLDRILGRIELTRPAEAAPPREPYFTSAVLDPSRIATIADYYDRILPDIDRRCRDLGARLVVINLHLHKPRRPERYWQAQDIIRDLVSDLTERHGIAMLDTGDVFVDDWRSCYLEHDGHLSPTGHERLAGFLHEQVFARSAAGE
jgi:hypothetical protein